MSGEMGAASTEETLGPLLNVLAQSLDGREIFVQTSALARQTVPHDRLMFGLITADGEHYRIVASSEDSQAPPAEIALSPLSQRLLKEDFAIFHHVRTLPGKTWGCAGRMRTASSGADEPFEWHPNWPWARGYESWMRLTVRLRGGVLGFLNFLSRAPDSYTEADVPAARRIADLVALAFAHERLAEEERRRAEAQERAAQLEGRVARLTAELDAAEGHRAIGTSKAWREVLAQAAKVAGAETTVLLTGESGTGKEVVAHLIHRGSRRGGTVRCVELRGAPRGVARVGAVRLREGGLHGGRVGARGAARAGGRGDAVSRRSGRDEPGGAGEGAAGAPGTGISAPRRHADAQGQRARDRRDEPRPAGGDDQGRVSRGSLLSAARVRDPAAAAARTQGGHPAAARALRGGARARGDRAAGGGHFAGGARAFPRPRLAGERARAAQRRGDRKS